MSNRLHSGHVTSTASLQQAIRMLLHHLLLHPERIHSSVIDTQQVIKSSICMIDTLQYMYIYLDEGIHSCIYILMRLDASTCSRAQHRQVLQRINHIYTALHPSARQICEPNVANSAVAVER